MTPTPKEYSPEEEQWYSDNGYSKNEWGNYPNAAEKAYKAYKKETGKNTPKTKDKKSFIRKYILDPLNRQGAEQKKAGEQALETAKRNDLETDVVTGKVMDEKGKVLDQTDVPLDKEGHAVRAVETDQGTFEVPSEADLGSSLVDNKGQQIAMKEDPTAPDSSEITAKDIATGDEMVQEAEQVARNPSPEDIRESMQKLIDFMKEKGLVTFDKEGRLNFVEPKTPTASVLARLGTVISALACVASGGLIPAANLYKLSGREDKDALIYNNYKELMSKVSSELGSEFSDYYRAAENETAAKRAGENRFTSSGSDYQMDKATEQQLRIMKQQFDNTIAQMQQANSNAKDYAEFMAALSAQELPLAINAAKDAGLSLEDIAKYAKSRGGITGWDDALNKAQKLESLVTSPIAAVTGGTGGKE